MVRRKPGCSFLHSFLDSSTLQFEGCGQCHTTRTSSKGRLQALQLPRSADSAPVVYRHTTTRMHARAHAPGMRMLGFHASSHTHCAWRKNDHHGRGTGYQPVRDQYAGLPTVSLRVMSDLVRTTRAHSRPCQGWPLACRGGERRCSRVSIWLCVHCLKAPPLHAELRTEHGAIRGVWVRERANSAPGRQQWRCAGRSAASMGGAAPARSALPMIMCNDGNSVYLNLSPCLSKASTRRAA